MRMVNLLQYRTWINSGKCDNFISTGPISTLFTAHSPIFKIKLAEYRINGFDVFSTKKIFSFRMSY
jgi:hypothetical protein